MKNNVVFVDFSDRNKERVKNKKNHKNLIEKIKNLFHFSRKSHIQKSNYINNKSML